MEYPALIHLLSIILLLAGIGLAFSEIRLSGWILAWILLSGALLVQGFRSILSHLVEHGGADAATYNVANDWMGLGFSLLIVASTYMMRDEFVKHRLADYKLRVVTAAASDAIMMMDNTGGIVYWNEAAQRIFGYSAQEAQGKKLHKLIVPERYRTDFEKGFDAVRSTGQEPVIGKTLELAGLRKEGTEIVTEHSISGVSVDGKWYAIFIVRDITERKRAEVALAHSRDLMRYIIEHNRSAVAVHDRDLKYIYVSQHYLQEYKVKEHDVIGKHHYDVFPDLPQKWRDVHQKALAGEISSAEDDPYVREDGTVDWTRWECRPWYEADGSIGGIIIYTEIVTERKRAEEKLRASEERFRAIASHTPDHILMQDRDLRYQFVVNPQLGLTGAGMIGKTDRDILGKEDAEKLTAIKRKVLETSESIQLETSLQNLKGETEFFEGAYIPKFEATGEVNGLIGYFRNITERKHSELALRASEAMLRFYVKNTPAAVAIFDTGMRYLLTSKRWLTDYRLGERDVTGISHYEAFPEIPERWKEIHRRCLAGATERCEADPFPRQDGSLDWVRWDVRPWWNSSGVIGGIIMFTEVITERKRAEEALGISETRYRSLFNNMVEGFAYCRMLFEDGRPQDFIYLDVNDAFQTLTGLKNVAKRKVSEVIPGIRESDPELFERYGRVALTGRPERFETYVVALNMWFSISVYCPEMEHFVAVFDVITERKRTEDALRNSSKRLRKLSQRLIEVEDGVRRKINRELHDRVGANLSAINLNLSIVGSQLPQKSLGAVGARLQDTQRLLEETTTHVRDLMADLHPPALDDYGLLAALRTYAESLGARLAVPISVHGEDLAPRLPLAVETALFRVAQGALANAVTHAQAKRIEILVAATADRVTLTITDDGVGFDAAQAAQAHASWGLTIMRERAEAVGATLTVESAPGKGTRVRVEISREKR